MKTVSLFALILAVCGAGLNTTLAQEPDDGGGTGVAAASASARHAPEPVVQREVTITANSIQWNPKAVSETLAPGETKTVVVTFTPRKTLTHLVVQRKGIKSVVSVAPTRFRVVRKGRKYAVSLTFAVPAWMPEQVMKGRVRLAKVKIVEGKRINRPLALPLPVKVTVQDAEPPLTLDPSFGPAGIAVHVSGTGFDGDCGVNLFLDTSENPSLGFASVGEGGTFTVELMIPQDALPGAHVVVGQGLQFEDDGSCGDLSGKEVSEVFAVTEQGYVTQTFSDIEPTPPREDEITAPPVDPDTTFPPEGPPVPPGPPGVIDSHYFEHGETIQEASSLASRTLATNSAAVDPAGEDGWLGKDDGVPTTGEDNSGDVAIHAALLRRTAKPTEADSGTDILWFAGDVFTDKDPGDVDHTGVFKIINPLKNQFKVDKIICPNCPQRQNPAPPPGKANTADLFCSGHALLGDGRLLVAGGTESFPPPEGLHTSHFIAIRNAFIFDPKTHTWSETSPMNFQPKTKFEPGTSGGGEEGKKGGGRWYPTLLTLNSGQVLAFWGHPAIDDTRPGHTNDTPEIFSLDTGWKFLGRETDIPLSVTGGIVNSAGYPRVHLLPNGRVFRASPVPDGASTKNVEINPIPQSLTDSDQISVRVSHGPGLGFNVTGDHFHSSVLLPLTPANKYRARILLAGGGVEKTPDGLLKDIAVQPQYIDLPTDIGRPPRCMDNSQERWCATALRDDAIKEKARVHANATILPTGEVFVSGGQHCMTTGCINALPGEIYNPFADKWRTVASAKLPRRYHSVALLMPDGRVWHAGTSEAMGFERQVEEVEIYEPWYYKKTRPVIHHITGAPDPIYEGGIVMRPHDKGSTFVVFDHFRDAMRFVLVRAGSATHAFNSDQRYIEFDLGGPPQRLPVVIQPPDLPAGVRRRVAILRDLPSSSIVPPGNYMLFVIDDLGVPSVGRFIRIDRQFVGELTQEAEDFTFDHLSFAMPVTVLDTTVIMSSNEGMHSLVEYGGVDFGTAEGVVKRFSALLSSNRRAEFTVRLDRADGPLVATLPISPTRGLVEQATSVMPVSGVHNVFIQFADAEPGPDTAKAEIDWFKFAQ